jgi:nicotinate-nucleotide pyrophosphorylase (carboxylating)
MQPSADDVRVWLGEDLGSGDITSEALVPPETRCTAALLLKEPGVICGLEVARTVFGALDSSLAFDAAVVDGSELEPRELAILNGNARAILGAERVALNLLGRLSGVATLTRRFVQQVAGTEVVILDTRKTTPGLRELEKWAVRCGGGSNHRHGLYDGILIKDNHLRLAGGIGTAVARVRQASTRPVIVECETLAQVREAVEASADRLLLDNMSTDALARAVSLVDGRAELEASGGITIENVRAVAETGVHFISIGALTHAAPALDVSLELLT